MHGIVMNQFRQFTIERLGRDSWLKLAASAGLPPGPFVIGRIYPDSVLDQLVDEAVRQTEMDASALVEEFGAFMAPALLRVYGPLVEPTWRTLDVIEHTERVIHTVVRARLPGAAPPLLGTRRVARDVVEIDYRSPRRLCALAKGISRGLALHFGETVMIGETECMHLGHRRCLITVRRAAEGKA